MSDIVRSDPAHAQHAEWSPPRNRTDPVSLLEAHNERRDLDLVPIRHGRMMVSPFTFYRGTATVMAADLATMPTAGLWVQLCGDAHLSNSFWAGRRGRSRVATTTGASSVT